MHRVTPKRGHLWEGGGVRSHLVGLYGGRKEAPYI